MKITTRMTDDYVDNYGCPDFNYREYAILVDGKPSGWVVYREGDFGDTIRMIDPDEEIQRLNNIDMEKALLEACRIVEDILIAEGLPVIPQGEIERSNESDGK